MKNITLKQTNYEEYDNEESFNHFEKIEKTRINLRIKTFNGKKFNKTKRKSKLDKFDRM